MQRHIRFPVASPPSDMSPYDDRDLPCVAALTPLLAYLTEDATLSGWTRAEALSAMLTFAAGQLATQAAENPTPRNMRAIADVPEQVREHIQMTIARSHGHLVQIPGT